MGKIHHNHGNRTYRDSPVRPARAKSLPLNMRPGMIQGIVQPSSAGSGISADDSEQSVAGAAAKGFAGGLVTGAQVNLGERVNLGAGDAAVRNADGQSLADLAAPVPGEDPLPGTTQPLALDVLGRRAGHPSEACGQERSQGSHHAPGSRCRVEGDGITTG